MKKCPKCGEEKHLTEFGSDKKAKDGLRTYCKGCNKAYFKAYYQEVIAPKAPPKKLKIEATKQGYRVCLKCFVEKPVEDFYRKGGNTCKSCANKFQRDAYYKNHERAKKTAQKYRSSKKDEIKERAAKARIKYNHSEYSLKKSKEYRERITEAYIRTRIRSKGIKNEDITPEMIAKKRAEILAERIVDLLEQSGQKKCSACGERKNIEDFYQRQWKWKGEKKYGIDNLCKTCFARRANKQYRKK